VFGECVNYGVLEGHQGAVVDVCYAMGGTRLVSVSSDRRGLVWDAASGKRVKTLKGHQSYVNAVAAARGSVPLMATASDDRTCSVWDARAKRPVAILRHQVAVLSVEFSTDATQLFSGGLDNAITCWDLRAISGTAQQKRDQQQQQPQQKIEKKKNENQMDLDDDVSLSSTTYPASSSPPASSVSVPGVLRKMYGHTDSLTGLRLDPFGHCLLSNSMDNTVRTWDVRAFVPDENNRLVKIYTGAAHDFQKQLLKCDWSADGKKISAGSSDGFAYIWDVASTQVIYKLPGHQGCVNQVAFHPSQPIIASCSNDKTIYLGEIQY